MATITEDYVSFEIAKLLKEKGFDEPCYTCYLNKEVSHYDYLSTNFELIDDVISAPTLQMAMKWLREVHNIHIVLHPYTDMEGHNWSFIFDKFTYGCWQELAIYITDSWNTYEDACEAAIKYCLENLI